MRSQEIAKEIATRNAEYRRLGALHLQTQIAHQRTNIKSPFPPPNVDPSCIALIGELRELEQKRAMCRPARAHEFPIGYFANYEAVWVDKGSPILQLSPLELRAISRALETCEVSDSQHLAGGAVPVSVSVTGVAEEDAGDAFLARMASDDEPTHRVTYYASRDGQNGAWTLEDAQVVELTAPKYPA